MHNNYDADNPPSFGGTGNKKKRTSRDKETPREGAAVRLRKTFCQLPIVLSPAQRASFRSTQGEVLAGVKGKYEVGLPFGTADRFREEGLPARAPSKFDYHVLMTVLAKSQADQDHRVYYNSINELLTSMGKPGNAAYYKKVKTTLTLLSHLYWRYRKYLIGAKRHREMQFDGIIRHFEYQPGEPLLIEFDKVWFQANIKGYYVVLGADDAVALGSETAIALRNYLAAFNGDIDRKAGPFCELLGLHVEGRTTSDMGKRIADTVKRINLAFGTTYKCKLKGEIVTIKP